MSLRNRVLNWFGPPAYYAYEWELRAALLRASLFGATLVALLYLALGGLNVFRPRLFPWDGLGLLAVTLVCIFLYRRRSERSIPLAASWLVAAINVIATFNSIFYGINHPVNALYVVGIVLAGMLVGGWFLPMWVALDTLFVVGWGVAELYGLGEVSSGAVQTTGELFSGVVFWWFIFALSGWLVLLFARHLESNTQIARGQTTALRRILNALTQFGELAPVLEQVLVTFARQLQADWAGLYLLQQETDALHFRLGYGHEGLIDADSDRQNAAVPSESVLPAISGVLLWQELRRRRRPIVVHDAGSDRRLDHHFLRMFPESKTILFVPVMLDDDLAGFFSINSPHRRRFVDAEIELAESLSQYASLALQMRNLTRQAQSAVVIEERNRMAREIHDTLAQNFTGIIIQLEAAEDVLSHDTPVALEHLARGRELARRGLDDARRSVWALRAQSLEEADLVQALKRLASTTTAPERPRIQVRINGTPYKLAASVEDELLGIAHEALHNALRHAEAQRIEISLSYETNQLRLEIVDDGRGFDLRQRSSGVGRATMSERAQRIHARLQLLSEPGKGTRVVCMSPIPRAKTTSHLNSPEDESANG